MYETHPVLLPYVAPILLYLCPHPATCVPIQLYVSSICGPHAASTRPARPSAARRPSLSRYSVYVLYWYKSTNTDAKGAARTSMASLPRNSKRSLARRAATLSATFTVVRPLIACLNSVFVLSGNRAIIEP